MKAEENSEERFHDGMAVIVELQGEAYLTVTPSRVVGRPVDIEDVLQKIRKKKIANVNEEIVKEVVDACPGEPIRITGDLDGTDLDRLRARDRDGFATLASEKDGVYLSVYPARGKGERLECEEVENYIKKNQITNVDYDLVRKMVKDQEGKAAKITSKPEKTIEDVVEISVSEDNMEAQIILHSTKVNTVPLDLTTILNKLKEKGVAYGIDKDKIEELLQGKGIGEQVVVARGDSDITYTFEIPAKGKPRIVQEGKVDYYRQDQLPLVKKSQVLVTKNPTEKKSGRNVKGEESSARDLMLIQGKNTLISHDGKELRAVISGYVYLSEGCVHVERESMVIKGNVNPSLGDIHFEGDIFIGRFVLPYSKVEAFGNIEVAGGVKEATIRSVEGNVKARSSQSSTITAKEDIVIEEEAIDSALTAHHRVSVKGGKGIVGGRITAGAEIQASEGDIYFERNIFIGGPVLSGSKIEAFGNIEVAGSVKEATIRSIEGSVKARSSQSSTITAKEDIVIEEEAIDSALTADHRVSVKGGKGIVGGRITAGAEIRAMNVGSSNARPTELLIRSSMADKMYRELSESEERIEDLKRKLVSAGKRLDTAKEKTLLFREMDSYLSLKKEVGDLISRKERLENTVIPKPSKWRMEISGTVYPGVSIYIGDSKIEEDANLKQVWFYDGKGQTPVSKLLIKTWLKARSVASRCLPSPKGKRSDFSGP